MMVGSAARRWLAALGIVVLLAGARPRLGAGLAPTPAHKVVVRASPTTTSTTTTTTSTTTTTRRHR